MPCGAKSTLFECRRWPALQLHAQGQAARGQHFLDFVERFAAQVGRLEQLVFGALDQVTDVVDVLRLETVGGADRELQLIDRTQQDRIELRVAARSRCIKCRQFAAFELGKYGQLFHQHLG